MQLHTMTTGLRQVGVHSLEKFNTLFGLTLAHILVGTTEEVSMLCQIKDIAIYSGSTLWSEHSKGILQETAFRRGILVFL